MATETALPAYARAPWEASVSVVTVVAAAVWLRTSLEKRLRSIERSGAGGRAAAPPAEAARPEARGTREHERVAAPVPDSAAQIEVLERELREARKLADLDPLTSLHNRRYFYEALEREMARSHRYSRSLALLVLDLDDFKAVNDTLGHVGGDRLLSEVAQLIRNAIRAADIACRVGGDEFAVILPEATADEAMHVYARFRQALERRNESEQPIEASAGVAELVVGDSPLAFFQRADSAAYRAKRSGKAQVAQNAPAGQRVWP